MPHCWKSQVVAQLLRSCCCVSAFVLCHFVVMQWVGLWQIIVAFPGHTHLFQFMFSCIAASSLFAVCYSSISFLLNTPIHFLLVFKKGLLMYTFWLRLIEFSKVASVI